ncbi:Ac68 [Dikerogammarus haemobaphes nudivirus]|nr:Ac68 [Dikerogammarus haemobaphes nudivirus]
MNLTAEYFQELLERNVIPTSRWRLKFIENEQCFVITDPIYCNVFWIDVWYHFISPRYLAQKYVNEIALPDLTLRVALTSSLKLLQVPPSLQNIVYYASITNYTPFKIEKLSLNTTMIISTLILLAILFFSFIFLRKKPALYYV